MRARTQRLSSVLVGLSLLVTSCQVEAERVQIALHDDLSSTVMLILVESTSCYQAQQARNATPDLETSRSEALNCGFALRDYKAKSGYLGFVATAEFKTKEELEIAFSCFSVLSTALMLRPPAVTSGLLGTDYELQMVINEPEYITQGLHEVRVTLPGGISLVPPDVPPGYSVDDRLEGGDTVIWQFPTPAGTGENTCKPLPVDTADSPIHLTARSHKSGVRLEWIISIVGLLFGSGAVWQILKSRRRPSAKEKE